MTSASLTLVSSQSLEEKSVGLSSGSTPLPLARQCGLEHYFAVLILSPHSVTLVPHSLPPPRPAVGFARIGAVSGPPIVLQAHCQRYLGVTIGSSDSLSAKPGPGVLRVGALLGHSPV